MSRPTLRPALLVLALALAALASACSDGTTTPPPPPPASPRLVFLVTTDEHSHLFAGSPERDDHPLPTTAGTGALRGGVARRHALLLSERAAAAARGIDTLTVSAGDWSQGTLAGVPYSVTAPELVLMARMGYDAIAVGNHEFDLGIGALAASIDAGVAGAATAGKPLPPLLLSNLTFPATPGADAPLRPLYGERGSGKPMVRSALLTTPRGIKVGLVSDLGPSAAFVAPLARPLAFAGTVTDYNDKPAAITAIAAQLQAEVTGLRGAGATVVVLLGHGGVATAPALGDDQLLAAALRGVDLVLSGHSHQQPDAVLWATDLDGKEVPILQPAPYGLQVGRAELVLEGGKVTLDTTATATRFLPVDDTIVPTTDAGVLGELDEVIYALESVPAGAGGSFLEQTLTLVETVAHGGVLTPVADDPAVIGDLFYRTVGRTEFDVPGLRAAQAGVRSGESAGLNLDTDAMWAAANNFSPSTTTTEIAVQASGPMRGDLKRGKTGQISFADVYNVVPLGGDPVEGTPGYPLVRFYLSAAEVWGAFEFSLLFSMQDSDFYLSPAGLEIAFDRSGPQFNPVTGAGGWITRMTLVDRAGVRTTIFDKAASPSTGGWIGIGTPTRLVSVVTTLYVAAFAQSAGITPRDSNGFPVADLNSTILPIPGLGAHWKDHQALAAYIAFLDASYWTLPSRYDERTAAGRVPQRVLCAGPVCP